MSGKKIVRKVVSKPAPKKVIKKVTKKVVKKATPAPASKPQEKKTRGRQKGLIDVTKPYGYCKSLLLEKKLTDKEILAKVKSEFPKSPMKQLGISCMRYELWKSGAVKEKLKPVPEKSGSTSTTKTA